MCHHDTNLVLMCGGSSVNGMPQSWQICGQRYLLYVHEISVSMSVFCSGITPPLSFHTTDEMGAQQEHKEGGRGERGWQAGLVQYTVQVCILVQAYI